MPLQNHVVEWTYSTSKLYGDPFNEVTLDVIVTDPDGYELTVPAFWRGQHSWSVRYASSKIGPHHYSTRCSDTANDDLHGQEGRIDVTPYDGDNPLMRHGPLRVAEGGRHLEHRDGTPFFWLGDTWWMGLVKRLPWPEGFKRLGQDRVKKGFSVIQLVAGLYPDMPPFDPRGANEAGFPWDEEFNRVNPAFFDMADLRIEWLVQNGLLPSIVGCWGYYMDFAGEEKLKQHWRYLVARYGAYPVVWDAAGEALMPHYSHPHWEDIYAAALRKRTMDEDGVAKTRLRRGDLPVRVQRRQDNVRSAWTRVVRYLREIDPYRHPVTIHPGTGGIWSYDHVDDPAVIDIDITQCGLHDILTFPQILEEVSSQVPRRPRMPRFVGESCYEGEGGWNWENVQRLMFWGSVLSGASGHTYGASGIWQVNTREAPYGPSPRIYGESFDEDPWDEAMHFAGSRQVGLGRRLLERFRWWQFEPASHWIAQRGEHHFKPLQDYIRPFAAGIAGEVRVIFIPVRYLVTVEEIEADVAYRAYYFDPRQGREFDIGAVVPDEEGTWQPPRPPIIQDWVLVLERENSAARTVAFH
ncbi:MAG: DUF4038 domain-containing protein [Caldilineaceae bacterium SB0668_bin_21]|nr:DUF4038 domain-containing protein [Caldilineaceae bacterium SB0668_bin_21]MYC21491.1 DUF4038 domain-containing protein [Caldilineaceae bacterium SB0662_bin_25]